MNQVQNEGKTKSENNEVSDYVTTDQFLCMAHGHEDEACIDERRLKLIRDAMTTQLTKEQHTIFILICYNGYSTDLIASKLSMTEDEIKQTYSDALTIIKKYCKENEDLCENFFEVCM